MTGTGVSDLDEWEADVRLRLFRESRKAQWKRWEIDLWDEDGDYIKVGIEQHSDGSLEVQLIPKPPSGEGVK